MKILRLTPQIEELLMRSREREDRTAQRAAAQIIRDVRNRGDAALALWAKKLDGADLKRDGVWIPREQRVAARKRVNREFVRAVMHATKNVRRVAERQLPRDWTLEVERGVTVGQLVRPLESVGCYVPGGRFALASTLIMTVVPAQVAGVKRIVVVCPRPNDELLAAADLLDVEHIARIGGAQAIAALAYGTKQIARVEKIFGPGNRYVTAAKQLVSLDCAIDLPAGPTEAIVLASDGNPRWIVADLLAQGEHAPDAACFLVTTSEQLAKAVQQQVRQQLKKLSGDNPAHISLSKTGAILIADSWDDACAFVNRFAPEHLSLPKGAARILPQIHSAGTVFLGPLSAQPIGDYASGSNHVLPTAGWARRRSGLSASDFVKCISVQTVRRQGFARLADDVQALARAEGLKAHSYAIEVRR